MLPFQSLRSDAMKDRGARRTDMALGDTEASGDARHSQLGPSCWRSGRLVAAIATISIVAGLAGCTDTARADSELPELHYFASIGDAAEVRRVLDAGVDVHLRTEDGATPLMISAGIHNDVSAMLIERGADLDLRDDDGWSAVMLAYYRVDADPEAVRMLVEAGADPTVPSEVAVFDGATLCAQARLDRNDAMEAVLC